MTRALFFWAVRFFGTVFVGYLLLCGLLLL